MTQSINIGVALGTSYTGLALGYRIQQLDGTSYAAFTTTNVAESTVPGTYLVTTAVNAPDAGGRLIWGVSGTDHWTVLIPRAALTTTDIDNRLAAYDPPTKAELDAAIDVLAESITAVDAFIENAEVMIANAAGRPAGYLRFYRSL